jgi:hypothetical protein
MKRNHDRSPDKKGFSVALPKHLLELLEKIAAKEHRSRNGQIEMFLEEAVNNWEAEQTKDKDPFPSAGTASHGKSFRAG